MSQGTQKTGWHKYNGWEMLYENLELWLIMCKWWPTYCLLVFYYSERCGMAEPVEGLFYTLEGHCKGCPLEIPCGYPSETDDCDDNIKGIHQYVSGICVAQIHEACGYHHHLLNWTRLYGILSQNRQKRQPPHADHVVCKDEVLFWKNLEALGVVYPPWALTSDHQLYIHQWDEAIDLRIPCTDLILMGYFMEVQVRSIIISVMYIIKSDIGVMDLRRILMHQRKLLFRVHLKNIRTIYLIGNCRSRVGDLERALWCFR